MTLFVGSKAHINDKSLTWESGRVFLARVKAQKYYFWLGAEAESL